MLAPLFAAFMLMQTPPAASEQGSDLYEKCVANVRVLDITDSMDGITTETVKEAQSCADYISGFATAFLVTKSLVCIPARVSTADIIRGYVRYMREHPKMMEEPKGYGVYQDLRGAYPCPTKK